MFKFQYLIVVAFILVFNKNSVSQVLGGVTGANLWVKANVGAASFSGALTIWTNQTYTQTTIANDAPQINSNLANFNPLVAFDETIIISNELFVYKPFTIDVTGQIGKCFMTKDSNYSMGKIPAKNK